jgi:rare lipoprotein A
MKQLTRIFVIPVLLAGFATLQAQDIYDYAGSASPSGTAAAPQGDAGRSSFPREGIASWYGTEFEGHPTASGELFNPAQLTAAHPSLPFGTMLRVTNTQNGRQVVVRVNDRGPFVNTRIIDVSRAAAEALDIISTGTAPVVVELASGGSTTPSLAAPQATPDPWVAPVPAPANPPSPPQPSLAQPPADQTPLAQPPASANSSPAVVKPGIPPLGTNKRYRVQVGAYKITRNAVETFDRVKGLGIEPSYERHEDYYRVVIAGLRAEDIQNIAARLGSAGFREVLVREE